MRSLVRAAVLPGAAFAVAASVAAFAAGMPVTAARVTVASTVAAVPIQTCDLTSARDAWVDATLLAENTNHGTETTMQVRSSVLGNRRSFVSFDLSSCSIPAGAEIRSAMLGIYLETAPLLTANHALHRVTAAWSEATITNSNQPGVAVAATATVATGTADGVTLQWNVVADVSAFVNGTANHGWRVADAAEGAVVARQGTYDSREHAVAARRPRLVVLYRP